MHAALIRAHCCLAAASLSIPLSVTQTHADDLANPIDAIIAAFRTHSIVAIDDEHGDERCAAFRLSLIRDPRFAELVDDIVVEFGNSKYQSVVDRFVSGGSVEGRALRAVWQDTTIPRPVWDRPIYEEFYRAVRSLNRTLPRGRQLRVLLGDPPIDWTHIHTADELRAASRNRSSFPADVIAREVLARNRRALVVYGGLHLMRQNMQGTNLIERLDARAPGRVFVVVGHPFANLASLGVDPASLTTPRLALTEGSSLENQLDAILYLGDASGKRLSRLTSGLCRDHRYRSMRVARMRLSGDVHAQEHFDQECSSAR